MLVCCFEREAVAIPTLPIYRVTDKVRVRVIVIGLGMGMNYIFGYIRRTQTVTLFPQLEAYCNVTGA